jgi:hypothetical protein
MTIPIVQNITIEKVEHYIELLESSELDIDLELPLYIENYTIGSKALLSQFFNSWVRKQEKLIIKIMAPSIENREVFISKFLTDNTVHALVLMTIRNSMVICDIQEFDLTHAIRKKALERLKLTAPVIINRKKAFPAKLSSIAESCFDHAEIEENRRNRWFYQEGADEPLQDWGFRSFYTAAIESLLDIKFGLNETAINEKFSEELTGIIKELFDNTHFHATENLKRIPLHPNIRSVFIDTHNITLSDAMPSHQTDLDPFFVYLLNPQLFKVSQGTKTFLEISVIDSGIGFAQRYTGMLLSELNSYVERQKVIECLTKYDRTAKKRGLKRVAAYLSERKGFLMLRTGRLSLYRNFLERPYQSGDYLVDRHYQVEAAMKSYSLWEGDENITSSYKEVCGSLITIFLPLEL